MSDVKISLKPTYGSGLSTKPTDEIIIDFETTGLSLNDITDPRGKIITPAFKVIDIGVIGVDRDLNETFFLDTLVEHGTPEEALAQIAASEFLTEMHGENGLIDDLERRAVGDARGMTFEQIEEHILSQIPAVATITLGGSGVANFDRPIVNKYMPRLGERLNYYPDDIGIERRRFRRSTGHDLVAINKDKTHRGFADARIHLEEIRAFHRFYMRAEALISAADGLILSD